MNENWRASSNEGLEAAHYAVDVEHDGEAALNWLLERNYDLVILDLMLPRLDGLSVMREIRRRFRRMCRLRRPSHFDSARLAITYCRE